MELRDPIGVGRGAAFARPMRFTGDVECRRSSGVQCITLVGRTESGEQVHLSLLGAADTELPPRLEAAQVEHTDADHYRVSSAGRSWTVSGRCYVHADASQAFYAAVQPRPVPFAKRFFWRVVLAAAGTRVAQRWLARSSA
jgi:hypothetical protein